MKRVAIVTGASRGIGACVAAGLVEDGYTVVITARSREALDTVASEIKLNATVNGSEKEPEILIYPLDVQDHQSVESMVADVVAKHDRIDVLFNNAGWGVEGTVDISYEDFDRVLSVNLKGAFNFLKAVVPVMKTQGEGTILNVASRAGKIGFINSGAYSASKFGLVGFSEALYRELCPLGIKVTTLCPSWVDTEMTKDAPVSRDEMLVPDDLLKTVRWLISLSPAAVVKDLIIECKTRIA
ncbi:MAG: SDR family oxidoreductase [Cyanobacteria bacterium]|nr:SDR family oxidoreductase [Cyanobacteriota bacterium]